MDFRPGWVWYHCWGIGNGGYVCEDVLREFPESFDESEIHDRLEGEFGPFSSGHRGFKIKRLETVDEMRKQSNAEYGLTRNADVKAAARAVMEAINQAKSEAEQALRTGADRMRGMREDWDPKIAAYLHEALQNLGCARDELIINPAFDRKHLKEE
jgi:hypothetical protein